MERITLQSGDARDPDVGNSGGSRQRRGTPRRAEVVTPAGSEGSPGRALAPGKLRRGRRSRRTHKPPGAGEPLSSSSSSTTRAAGLSTDRRPGGEAQALHSGPVSSGTGGSTSSVNLTSSGSPRGSRLPNQNQTFNRARGSKRGRYPRTTGNLSAGPQAKSLNRDHPNLTWGPGRFTSQRDVNLLSNQMDPQRSAAPPQMQAPEEPMEVDITYNPWCQALKQVVHECDCALSAQIKHLSALKRQRILAAVQNAVDSVQKMFEETRKNDVEASEIVRALGTSAERLSEILPDMLNDAAQMRSLTEKLGCNADELEKRIEEKEEEIAVLKAKLDAFQVGRPAEQPQPRRPSHPEPAPRVGKFDGHAWSRARDFVKFVDITKSLQSSHTTVCARKTEWPRSNQIPKSDASSQMSHSSHLQGKGRVSPSSCGSSCRPASAISQNENLLKTLKEVLKSQSIAEVKKYDGKSSLTEFLRGLEVKYPRSVWSDTDRRDILLNHLKGAARTHANNLPAEILDGSFDGIVEELWKARSTPGERLKAQADWGNLRKLETESVFDFCCRLRSIAKRKSPDSDCDFEMGSKLYECLSEWKDSYYMLAALDSPEGTVFDEVRKVALRLERTREPTTSAVSTKTWNKRFGNGEVEQKQEQSTAVPPQSPPRKLKGDNPRPSGIPHQQRGPPRNPRNWDRPKPVEKLASTPNASRSSSTQSRQTQNAFSTHLKSWCCKIKRVRLAKPVSAYGGPCHCNIEIFGMKAKALIDTGSVITVIPLGLLKKAMEQGADLDKMVMMMGDGSAPQVYDASGNPMSFLMLIAATISVEGAASARVQMHIQKSDSDMILIGTNAMESLGIRIQLGSSAKEGKRQRRKRVSSQPLVSAAHKTITPPKLELTGPTDHSKQAFLSSDGRIASAVSQVSDGHTTVSVVTRESQQWIVSKGQPVGTSTQDQWYDPRTADAADGKAKHRKSVFDRRGPQRVRESNSSSALITRIGLKLPSEIDDTPVIGKSTRGRRGRLGKQKMADAGSTVKRPKFNCNFISCSTTISNPTLFRDRRSSLIEPSTVDFYRPGIYHHGQELQHERAGSLSEVMRGIAPVVGGGLSDPTGNPIWEQPATEDDGRSRGRGERIRLSGDSLTERGDMSVSGLM